MNLSYMPILGNNFQDMQSLSHYYQQYLLSNSLVQDPLQLSLIQGNNLADQLCYNPINNSIANQINYPGYLPTPPINLQNLAGINQYLELYKSLEMKNCYEEINNLNLKNKLLTSQINDLMIENNQILSKISMNNPKKKKRNRRPSSQINRFYACFVLSCSKSYGSEGSLYQHIKLKHPNFDLQSFLNSNKNCSAQISPMKENSIQHNGDRISIVKACPNSNDSQTSGDDAASNQENILARKNNAAKRLIQKCKI